jgi:hypothetical protein
MPNISFYCQEEFEASSYKWLHTKTQPIGHRIRLHQPFSVNYFSTKQKFMIYVHLPVHEVYIDYTYIVFLFVIITKIENAGIECALRRVRSYYFL